MHNNFLISLIQNITILLSFSMMYDYFWIRRRDKINKLQLIGTGIFIALIGYLLIRTPWTMIDGIFFDTRTILLATAGLFLGAVPTIIAMVLLSAYRLSIGGEGIWMGMATIISSGVIGILWRHFRPEWKLKKPLNELLVMGIIVHLVMLACVFLLPEPHIKHTFTVISFEVIVIYPIAVVLLGLLILRQEKNKKTEENLAESEERWRFAIEGSGDGLWDWDVQSDKIYFSPTLTEMLGYTKYEMTGKLSDWEDKIHPECAARAIKDVTDFVNGKTDRLDSEYRMMTKSGSYIWIQDRGMAMERDQNGKAIRCIGTHRNITAQKITEEKLLESQQYTNSILSAIPDLIFVLNSKGIYLDFKSGNKEDLYLSPDIFFDKNISDILPQDIAKIILDSIQKVLKNNKYETIEYKLEVDKKVKDFECHVLPFAPEKVIVMVRNITERKKAELQLLESQSELKRFAAHLQNIREDERISLAREIHDELGQILVAVKMELGMLIKKNDAQTCEKCEKLKENFIYLQSLVDQTIKTARKIMTDLRPEVLDMLGIIDAIRQHTQKFQNHYKINTIFSTETEDIEISREQSVALFRIVQEALTNVVKHAKATEVHVMLGLLENGYYLEISDNGIGFDTQTEKHTDSYGMIGMKERAYLINANLKIESPKGKGVTVRLEWINEKL